MISLGTSVFRIQNCSIETFCPVTIDFYYKNALYFGAQRTSRLISILVLKKGYCSTCNNQYFCRIEQICVMKYVTEWHRSRPNHGPCSYSLWPKQVVARLSPQVHGFNRMPVYMGFVVYETSLGHFLFSELLISPVRVTHKTHLSLTLEYNFHKSDVWLTVHRNSVWIRKTN